MGLNAAQNNAVSHMGSPLQVKAGPGSGKTRVIVEKASMLVKQGIPQESILCMTFTEKAADVMLRRLQEKHAGNVRVGTIHALCLEILKDNSSTTGISDGTIIFSDISRLAWCVRNIDKFGIDTDVINLSRTPKNICSRMLNTILLAQREMITEQNLEAYIQNNDNTAHLKELLKVYRAYAAYKLEKDLIDYEDMVAMTVKHLQQNPAMLAHYKEKFQYVLVDEFQDNNYAQFMLAKLLAGNDNITVVGDEDQSIMSFQGAFDGIFEEFADTYKNQKSVTLEQNYRCSGNISNVSVQLLNADPDIKLKNLHANKDDGEPITVVAASSVESENQFVAETISKLDVQYDKIAVLCRTNIECQRFAETLRSHGISATLTYIGNMMRNSMVSEIISLLKIANSPYTSGLEISHILKIGGIHEHNIRDLNSKAWYNKNKSTDGVFSTLGNYSGSDQDVEIREIGHRLQRLTDKAKSATLLEILHKIMTEYSDVYKKNVNMDKHDSARNLAILNKLYDIAKDYATHYGDGRLPDFIQYLDFADESNIGDMDSDYMDTKDAVNVMTIHKSKGKEFDVVFVTGLYNDNIPSKYKADDLTIPTELLRGKGRVRDLERVHLREQRHLLYVGMTRAENKLYLTYPKQAKESKKEKAPSTFLDDIKYANNPRIHTIQYAGTVQNNLPPKNRLDLEKFRIQEDACKAIRESRPESAIRNIIHMAQILHVQKNGTTDGFNPDMFLDIDTSGISVPSRPNVKLLNKERLTLSATDIITYQKCPLQFKYRKVLKVPQGPSVYLTKGTAIHGAIERLANDQLKNHNLDVAKAKQAAKKEMETVRHMYDTQTFENVYTSLDDIIDQYVEWNNKSENNLIGTEVKFDIVIDGITYKGKIDRIETDADGNYIVVDFKTGKSTITKKDVKIHPQTNIYAAAIKDKYGSLPIKVSLYYLEKGAFRDYMVDEESLENGLGIVRECAQRIIHEDFPAKISYDCNFCAYKHICPSFNVK